MGSDNQTEQLPLIGYVLQAVAVLFIVLPWIVALCLMKNRRLWLWWRRLTWKASGMCVLGVLLVRFIAFSLVSSRVGIDSMGGYEAISGFLFTFGFIELYPIMSLIALVHTILPSIPSGIQSLEFYVFDFVVLFAVFSVLLSVKTYLAKKAYEIE